jgi:hypothetical protein
MFLLIESRKEIDKAQRKLEITIRREFNSTAVKNLNSRGGTISNAKVLTDGKYWYWTGERNHSHSKNPRHLNLFGLLKNNANLQITVQTNTSYEGRNDKVEGFFAINNRTGLIYLLHSGGVGGGMRGVGKSAFLAWSNQRLIEVADSSGGIREGVLVMPIEGVAATQSAVRYIDTVDSFKKAVRAGDIATPKFQRKMKELDDFYSESRGRRKGQRSSEIDYLSRHGDIVDALYAWRNLSAIPNGGRLVKNVLFDMGVKVGSALVEIYEVKTSTTRSDIYSAIGQLMVHGSPDKCRRVMVLPQKEPLATDLEDALKRLDIELLRFKFAKDTATID